MKCPYCAPKTEKGFLLFKSWYSGECKSRKVRLSRISHVSKISIAVAVIVLMIAAIAVGCSKTVDPAELEIPETGYFEYAGMENTTPSNAASYPGESFVTYDREYQEEVDRELASFTCPVDIKGYISDTFDTAIPEDDLFDPMTLADYIYATDGWKFIYDSEKAELEPDARLVVQDSDGRLLWIAAPGNELMIEEADGSFTSVTNINDPIDCADMIRHLLPWVRMEYHPENEAAASSPTPLPPEIPEGWVDDYVLEGDERQQAMDLLRSFATPDDVSMNTVLGYVIPAENAAADFSSFVDAHNWTIEFSPESAANEPDAQIILTNADGLKLYIVSDLDYMELVLEEELWENNHAKLFFYDGAADGDYLRELWPWAQSIYSLQAVD